MTDAERTILWNLQRYASQRKRLSEVEEQIKSETYKLTPTYGNCSFGGSRANNSKVESFADRLIKLKRQASEYRKSIWMAEEAMHCPTLTKTEKEALLYIAQGGKLSEFAKARGIYSSNIYKIRDKALTKASKHISGCKSGKKLTMTQKV